LAAYRTGRAQLSAVVDLLKLIIAIYPATAAAAPTRVDRAALSHSAPALAMPHPRIFSPPLARLDADLIEFIDFKGLWAGKGHRIDLGRLRSELA
jgi:hypothetical protein